MSPPQFLNYDIPVEEDLTHMHGMVTPDLVVGHTLVLAGVLLIKKGIRNHVLERGEVRLRIVLRIDLMGVFRN